MKETDSSNGAGYAFGLTLVYLAFPWLLIPTFVALIGWGVYRLVKSIIDGFRRGI